MTKNEVTKVHYTVLDADVRVLVKDDESIWFVSADIAKMLDIKNMKQNLADMPDGVCNTYPILDSLGRTQNATIVSEAGLYRLIFRSRKPEAEAFVTWVTEEVLPQIRKTGSYSTKKETAENPIAYHLDISDRLGRCGFSRGVQQAYLLEEDQKLFDSTARHMLPELARIEARQEVAKITFDRSEDTNFACCIPVSDFKTFTTTELAKKFNDKRVTSKVINDWLCDGKFQKRISPRKYMKLDRGRDVATTRHTYSGETQGLDIVSGWRYTAEVQKYLESRYRELL